MVCTAVVRTSPFSKVYMFDMRKVKRISRFMRQYTVVCITNCRLLFREWYLKTLNDETAQNALLVFVTYWWESVH